MEEGVVCEGCGATNSPGASWCSLCLQPIASGAAPTRSLSPTGAPARPPDPQDIHAALRDRPRNLAEPGSPTGSRADAGDGAIEWICGRCRRPNPRTHGDCASCGLPAMESIDIAQRMAGGPPRPVGILERIEAGLRLTAAGLRLVAGAPQLLVIPGLAVAATITVLLLVSIVVGVSPMELAAQQDPGLAERAGGLTVLFVGYVFGVLAQASVVVGAAHHFSGRRPSLDRIATEVSQHLGPLFRWAAVDCVVGLVLDALRKRGGVATKILGAAAELAWHTAHALVIPAIVFEGEGLRGAMRRSRWLIVRVWSQTLVGGFGLGIALTAITFVLVVALIPVFALSVILGVALLVAGLIAIQLAGAVAGGGLTAALYVYATRGDVAWPFDRSALRLPGRDPV